VRIACVGGGPAGLYFSILMKRRDESHDITIFERSKAATTYGWGVTFGGSLLQSLYRHDPESAQQIEQAALSWHEQVVCLAGERISYPSSDAYNINRQRLLDILAARAAELGVNIVYDREVLSRSELPEADLVVATDGISSRIREAAGTFRTDVQAGRNKYIWLGTAKVFESFSFLFARTESGWVWAHAYGIDASSSTFVVECAADTWAALGFDTMPAGDVLAALETIFKDHLDGHSLVGTFGDGTTARWLNFRTISNQAWHDGTTVLAGDSAHTAHFAVGLGTTLALQDVITLAGRLQDSDGLEAALQSYEQQRQAELVKVLSEARCSARWFENVDRYIGLKPHQFAVLLHARRSPLLPLLPPRVAFGLHEATDRIGVLRGLRDRLGPMVKVRYGRRESAKVSDGAAGEPATTAARDQQA
jgi:2-polyprenyl-6-methoxyphenol hydroxylase-like FAD-dependent oxidoreductase